VDAVAACGAGILTHGMSAMLARDPGLRAVKYLRHAAAPCLLALAILSAAAVKAADKLTIPRAANPAGFRANPACQG
jgi:hypothetical protein